MSQKSISELEAWFAQAPKPELPVQLYPGVKL